MHTKSGFSLIDVIIGVALLATVFVGLMTLLRVTITVSAQARTKSAMTELAESQMEYMRGISYDALGTVGGDPVGEVVGDEIQTVDGTSYAVHTAIVYNDSTDAYKIVEVTVAAPDSRVPASVLVSNVAP